jgi:hypothetical protein
MSKINDSRCGTAAAFAVAAIAACMLTTSPNAYAQGAGKKRATPPVKKGTQTQKQNEVRGTQQMTGAVGRFGEIYTLKSGFNFQIVSAHYSLAPYNAYSQVYVGSDQKLLILQIAIKNSGKQDAYYDTTSHTFTAVDQNNQNHMGDNYLLTSMGNKQPNFTIKPAQGIGQKPTDPLTVAIVVPTDVRIGKIILNQGRLNTSEDVMRFFVAGTEGGDPKNIVAPLPETIRDPADSTGVIVKAEIPGKAGTYYPSGYFSVRLDSFSYPGDVNVNNAPAEEGKRFASAQVTVRNDSGVEQSFFQFGDTSSNNLVTSEGDRITFLSDAGMRKPSRDAAQESRNLKPGEEVTFRCYFAIPKEVTAKTFTVGQPGCHQYTFDVSGVK